ncbi:MAG: phospholipase D family protein [Desulfomonile sp.]|jgi:phosphatidylserine/phosphatidylglycerophosphate/cardiolipin synthase-like enzyme|nr:phospholipase D family protein [Deltaproteobacteria bacterium]
MKTLFDREIYEHFTQTHLLKAQRFIWIATANIKATALRYRNRFVSFPDLMAIQANRGVSIRIIHAEIPSRPFRERYERLDSSGRLSANVEFLQCIRLHAKIFIVDGSTALLGSPNLTGSGIGAKSQTRRNFEIGFLFEGEEETLPFVNYFDQIWMGVPCSSCNLRPVCPVPAAQQP